MECISKIEDGGGYGEVRYQQQATSAFRAKGEPSFAAQRTVTETLSRTICIAKRARHSQLQPKSQSKCVENMNDKSFSDA